MRSAKDVVLGLSDLGARRGWDHLTYNPGVMWMFHRFAVENALGVVGAMHDEFGDRRRWLDVGAGTAQFARAATRLGHDTLALERSRVGRWIGRASGQRTQGFDLRDALGPTFDPAFDLAFCFEVAEHLPPDLGLKLVDFLAEAAPVVVFTAAAPGQGGTGHINEQPRDFWITRFASRGMVADDAAASRIVGRFPTGTARWFAPNLMVLRRA